MYGFTQKLLLLCFCRALLLLCLTLICALLSLSLVLSASLPGKLLNGDGDLIWVPKMGFSVFDNNTLLRHPRRKDVIFMRDFFSISYNITFQIHTHTTQLPVSAAALHSSMYGYIRFFLLFLLLFYSFSSRRRKKCLLFVQVTVVVVVGDGVAATLYK